VATPAATVDVEVGGRALRLSNLQKVLYPASGFTKAEVIDYYARIAPVMLPHLAGRALTFKRYPDGVDGESFFEKRCPGHRPPWVRTAIGPSNGRAGGGAKGDTVPYCVLDEPAALVWAANLAALELHAPMALAKDLETPRAVVFDLDPGPPAGIPECARVALGIREVLAGVGLEAWAKTSGSKGLQLAVPLNTPATHDEASRFALAVGQVVEQHHPGVLTEMARHLRPGKVFVDWSQNSRHKTTIAVYSMRARPHPTASTPVTWDEVAEAASDGLELRFEAPDVLARVDAHGDLFAPVLTTRQVLPGRSA
jgi:bifunctional non-homologous end joining protein LigD